MRPDTPEKRLLALTAAVSAILERAADRILHDGVGLDAQLQEAAAKIPARADAPFALELAIELVTLCTTKKVLDAMQEQANAEEDDDATH